jgi:hypothetical protein
MCGTKQHLVHIVLQVLGNTSSRKTAKLCAIMKPRDTRDKQRGCAPTNTGA